ncbi:hypothetical protein DV735_g1501, partial [Chaetothyriales sp. CBS 134920]
MTPPESAAGQRGHSRNYSTSSLSYYTNSTATDTSPESVLTAITTPSRSPILGQNGPLLLPKIRTQDSSLTPSAAGQSRGGHRRGSSTNSINSTHSLGQARQRPAYRCATEPVQSTNLMSPISNPPVSRSTSLAPTPSPGLQYAHLHRARKAHSRHASASSVDSTVLSRFGYPTYRQVPAYPMQQPTPSPSIFPEDYLHYQNNTALMDPPVINLEGTFDMPSTLDVLSRPISLSPSPPVIVQPAPAMLASQPAVETYSLINHLTQPTPAINLVRHLSSDPGRLMSSHFWWDIRNLRPWTEFNVDTFSSMPDLLTLLQFQHASSAFPSVYRPGSHLPTLSPASEPELVKYITATYFPRCNLGTQLSLGHNSIHLYPAPLRKLKNTASAPTFLANHPTDSDRTLTGLPRGRMVGLCKSYEKWNSAMYKEEAPAKVKYLKGLAHLQKCMRDHSCRYGFIITEIELVCVRAGADESGEPYFGYLELSDPIPTNTYMPEPDLSLDYEADVEVPMTASLALYFLLMLSKMNALPGQLKSFMDVGAPGALTRQRVWHGCDVPEEEQGIDGKDKGIPEPQLGEKREARTVRGWALPSDPWHKREGGRSKRRA